MCLESTLTRIWLSRPSSSLIFLATSCVLSVLKNSSESLIALDMGLQLSSLSWW